MSGDSGDVRAEVSRARRVVRYALRGALALTALLVLLVVLIHTSPGQNLIRGRVVAALNKKMNGSASLDALSVSLVSGVSLSGLSLKDATGAEVVRVDELSTKLTLSKLLSGEVAVDHLKLHGVTLALKEAEGGGTNLSTLFKKSPPKPKTTKKKKKSRRISVASIDVSRVNVSLKKLDGSSLAVRDLAVQGHVSAVASEKTVALSLDKIALNLERKNKAVTLGVSEFKSALNVDLVGGKGTVSLKPTSAKLSLARPEKPPFSTPVSFNGVDLDVAPGSLSASLKKLAAGLALLDSLELSGSAEGGALVGDQSAVIAGLSLKKEKVNVLLGKELLASDLKLQAKVGGPPQALSVAVDLNTAGGTLKLSGTADVSKLERPKYDLRLEGSELESDKLVHSAKVPKVEVKKIVLQLKGSEIKKKRIDADVALDVGDLSVKGIKIDGVKLRGRYERGTVKITELTIDGLGQKLKADGTFVIASRELSLNLKPSGDVGKALTALAAAGIKVKTKIAPGRVVLREDETHLVVRGNLNERLDAEIKQATVRVGGGSVTVYGSAALNKGEADAAGKKKFSLAGFSGDVRLNNVGLASLARLRGKNLKGYDGRIQGRVQVHGTKQDPKAKIALRLATRPSRPGRRRAALVTHIDGKLNARGADVTLKSVRRDPSGAESDVLELDAKVPLSLRARRLRRNGELRVSLDLPRRPLSSLRDVLPDSIALKLMKYPDAHVEAHVKIEGTAAKPRGSFDIDLDTEMPLLAEDGGRQRVALTGTVTPTSDGSHLEANLRAWLDHRRAKVVNGDISADLKREGRDTQVAWNLGLSVEPPALEALPARIRRPGLSGKVAVRADLQGTRKDVGGRVVVTAKRVHRNGLGPLDLNTQIDLGAQQTTLGLKFRAAGIDAVGLKGTVGVAGKNLIPTLRAKKLGDPTLDAELTVVRQRVAKYAVLRKKLEKVPGDISGRIALTGTVKQPLIDGGVALDEFKTLDGSPGRADLRLSAQAEAVLVQLGLGDPKGGTQPVLVKVETSRPQALALLKTPDGETNQLAVKASARANQVPLVSLVPKSTLDGRGVKLTGNLNWKMDADLQLAAKGKARRLEKGSLRGDLRVDKGSATIPNTKRRYHKVELAIVSSDDELRIDRISLAEKDIEKSKRALDIKGKIAWANLKPQGVNISLRAKDWLLFGGKTLGRADAPRAALTSNIDVKGDLTGSRRRVDVTVSKLDLKMPDRFNRAHWPEDGHLGDMLVLGEKGVTLGKLPVPEAVKNGSVHIKEPKPPPADSIVGGTDIHLSIPNTAHIQKPPFELYAHGKLVAKLRPGLARPEIRGELPLTAGAMTLGGRLHPIAKGKKSRIVFDERSPRGRMETHLLKQAETGALRDISKASAQGDTVRLYLEGPIGKPKSKVNGAGNADLWDMLPVYNAGRVKWTSQPDLAGSVTVQVPRKYDVILLSYMAVNLPHNLFLDRINAWSDPEDVRGGYGQIRNLEAEKSSKSGVTRIVTTARPPSAGRSDAELEVDWMWVNTPRTKAGLGVAAGNRVGGGPALFFDWSSED